MNYLDVLNPIQRKVVLHHGGVLLILAGAGTGKTRVITTKIAHLIDTHNVSPYNILAVTFTNKAAAEMKERAIALTPHAERCHIRTFHSFGAWMVRRYAEHIGISPNFSIYDDDDSTALLRSLYPDMQRGIARMYAKRIARAKDSGLRYDDDFTPLSSLSSLSEKDESDFRKIYERYQTRLMEIGNVDFGDLIMHLVQLLRTNSAVREELHNRFKVILVDEYQDSNAVQFHMLRLLAGKEAYLCVVGDDDQSIYQFRGAEVRNILTFADTFQGTQTIRLEQNYRSTSNILKVAHEVVTQNSSRLGKKLWTKNDEGPAVRLAMLEDEYMEADYCIRSMRDTGAQQVAILYRTNAQSRVFETMLNQRGIPYKLIGSLRFYDREEIKDAIALLHFILNPRDEIGFQRIIKKIVPGVGAVTIQKIMAATAGTERDILAACRHLYMNEENKSGKPTKIAAAVSEFVNKIDALKEILYEDSDIPLSQFVRKVIENSGLWKYHQEKDAILKIQKIQNLEELINSATLFEDGIAGLTQLLESIALDSTIENEPNEARVSLITIHNTKGLEFDHVCITGINDGLFPSVHMNETSDIEQKIEEERRLFYVAITRARRHLYFTTTRRRMMYGQLKYYEPSRFLQDIPQDMLQIDNRMEKTHRTNGYGIARHSSIPPNSSTNRQEYHKKKDRQDRASEYLSNSENSYTEQMRFPVGVRVSHDNYGHGEVVKNWENGHHRIVFVHFFSGQNAQFIEKYAALDIIAE